MRQTTIIIDVSPVETNPGAFRMEMRFFKDGKMVDERYISCAENLVPGVAEAFIVQHKNLLTARE